jgi:hypothetical protein
MGWLGYGRGYVAKRDARHRLAARYEMFRPFPGSVKVGETISEDRSDGNPTGSYSMEVTFRLPRLATAAAVLGHYRSVVPTQRIIAEQPPPPTMSLPANPVNVQPTTPSTPPQNPERMVLLNRATQLTVFVPGEDGTTDGRIDGITIKLIRTGGTKLVQLGPPTFGCADPTAEPSDHRSSGQFDAP